MLTHTVAAIAMGTRTLSHAALKLAIVLPLLLIRPSSLVRGIASAVPTRPTGNFTATGNFNRDFNYSSPSNSSFRPTALFGDHMVLQATEQADASTVGSASAHLSGLAAPGAAVTLEVALGGKTETTLRATADKISGRWDIGGIKGAMNQGPFVLTLRSTGETRVATDVWFGTVIMCTGRCCLLPAPAPALPACACSSCSSTSVPPHDTCHVSRSRM